MVKLDALFRTGLARHKSIEDCTTALAQDVADDARKLDVGVFELLDPPRVAAASRTAVCACTSTRRVVRTLQRIGKLVEEEAYAGRDLAPVGRVAERIP